MEIYQKKKYSPPLRLARMVCSYVPFSKPYWDRKMFTKAKRKVEEEEAFTQLKEEAFRQMRDKLTLTTSRPMAALKPSENTSSLNEIEKKSTGALITVSAEDLQDTITQGRQAMLAYLGEKNVPIPVSDDGQDANLDASLLRVQLVRSDLMRSETVAEIKDRLWEFDEPQVQKNAVDLLGGIVLDGAVYSEDVRTNALKTLISTSSFSELSKDMLMRFGFSEKRIEKMAEKITEADEYWETRHPVFKTMSRDEVKHARRFGAMVAGLAAPCEYILFTSVLGTNIFPQNASIIPLAVIASVMGYAIAPYYFNTMKKINRIIFSLLLPGFGSSQDKKLLTADRVVDSALDETDEFQKLLQEKRIYKRLPAVEKCSIPK